MSTPTKPIQETMFARVQSKLSRVPVYVPTLMVAFYLAGGCAGDAHTDAAVSGKAENLHGLIGPDGGDLVGSAGTPFAGLSLHIPPGALEDPTELEVRALNDAQPLPAGAVACGPLFEISPVGLALAKPATLTLPFSETAVDDNERFDDEVKVWWLGAEGWGQREQTDSHSGSVSVEISALSSGGAGVNPPDEQDIVHLVFYPDPNILPCLAQYPDDAAKQPSVEADVVRGDLTDGLFLHGKNIKPELKFDLFTIERSLLQADGTRDPNFHGFGFAWYQSDLEASDHGALRASIRTILLDQIFGFDPDAQLQPTNTFEVGFWFNDPNDAAACGFDPSKPTPFNGEHRAGPLAMTTVPDAKTGLGPLCTKPDDSVRPARCDP
jgi:hypothetical protein